MKTAACILACAMIFGLVAVPAAFGNEPAPVELIQTKQMDQADQQVELTGTLASGNLFIDESGENYQLIPSEKSAELQAHLGEKVKVKATVMENNEGFKSIEVSNYEIITE